MPIHALGQLTPVDSMLWGVVPTGGKIALYLLALTTLVVVGRIMGARLAGQRHASFWLTGAGPSLISICGSAPWDRHLVFVGMGAAPAMAMAAFVQTPAARRWPRVVVGTLAVFNLVLAPLLLPIKSLTMMGMSLAIPWPDAVIPRDAAVTKKTLVIPWLELEAPLWFTWATRDAQGI